MNQPIDPKQLTRVEQLEKLLYSSLGKEGFIYIDVDAPKDYQELPNAFAKTNKRILSITKKADKDRALREFISLTQMGSEKELPEILKTAKSTLEQPTFLFLSGLFWLHRYRWYLNLADYDTYALEFFLDPELIERYADEDIEPLRKTIEIPMPYALIPNPETGDFDLEATRKKESKFHLIKSRLATIATIESKATFLRYEFEKLYKWPFFVIGYPEYLQNLAEVITQFIFDFLYAYTYSQLGKGFAISEAQANAYSFLDKAVKEKRLTQFPVYRFEEPTTLSKYLHVHLEEFAKEKKLRKELVSDFYTHIFNSIEKVYTRNIFKMVGLYEITLRESTALEQAYEGNNFTLIVSPVLKDKRVLSVVRELYKIVLPKANREALFKLATKNFEQTVI